MSFLDTWIRRFIIPQPESARSSLTWFVGTGKLYRCYYDDAMRHHERPVSYEELIAAIATAHPQVDVAKHSSQLPILTGIRYCTAEGTYIFGV